MTINNKKAFIIVVLASGIAMIVLVYFTLRPQQKEDIQEEPQQLIEENILKSLSIPSGGSPSTKQEKRQIIEGLSKPSREVTSSVEKQREIEEALQKPAQ